jgi:hypothetical protein
MILNSYAVLDLALSSLRLIIALLVIALAAQAWRRAPRPLFADERDALDDRVYLVSLLGLLLVVLSVLSWPLLYLLLQSYVGQWPGVMCIYGVTRIGTGSISASRLLPGLLTALELSKPALVFCAGAWLILYWIHRQTATGPLVPRLLIALMVLGLLGAADAIAENAYVLIPKQNESLPSGCCTNVFDDPAYGIALAPDPVLGAVDRPVLTAAYFALNVGMVLALSGAAARPRRLLFALTGAMVVLPVTIAFLIEVAAPIVLHLPYHHCPYDLIPAAPEITIAVALFLGATFCVGWACVAAVWGNCAESQPFLPADIGAIVRVGRFGYLASMAMIAVELAVA